VGAGARLLLGRCPGKSLAAPAHVLRAAEDMRQQIRSRFDVCVTRGDWNFDATESASSGSIKGAAIGLVCPAWLAACNA